MATPVTASSSSSSPSSSSTTSTAPARRRPPVDVVMRKLLLIPTEGVATSERDLQRRFSTSIAVSAVRCLLTYVFLPFVAPAIGVASGVGPWAGIVLSSVGITFDILTVRRFWAADHRWRHAYTVVVLGVAVLLGVLLVADLRQILG